MKLMAKIALLAAALVLAACSTTYSTQSDYRPDHDFSGYKTYAWAPEKSAGSGYSRYGWANSRIKYHVERALAAKGYRRVDAAEQADFTVRLAAETRPVKRRHYEQVYPDFYARGYYRGYRGYYPYRRYYDPYYGVYLGYPYYYDPFGYYHRPYYHYPRREVVRVRKYQERTISLDIIDAESGQAVWFGSSEERLGADYSEAPDAPISKVIAELLEDFPPR